MFENIHINRMLEVQFNKKCTDITKEDLLNVKNMFFSKSSNTGMKDYNLEELSAFHNLTNLTIASSLINKEDINKLKSMSNLKNISFSKCIMSTDLDFSGMKSLESLELERCFINDFSFMKTIENCTSLAINYPYNEDDEKININYIKCSNLKNLSLEGCEISNEYSLTNLTNLENISLIYTDVSDFSFVQELDSLEKLYVSSKYLSDSNLIDKKFQVSYSTMDMVMDDIEGNKKLI